MAAAVACSSAGDGAGSPSPTPNDGVLDFDAAQIPLPPIDLPDATVADVSSPPPPPLDAQTPDAGEEAGPIGGQTCSGSPTPCASAVSCAAVAGCSLGGACSGVSLSCFQMSGSFACGEQQGCFWSATTNSCTGDSFTCNLLNGSLSCADQQGCNWQTACTGTPTPCSALTVASCATQPGCFVE